jgi:uncharacterized RDD family membrane protein YckC
MLSPDISSRSANDHLVPEDWLLDTPAQRTWIRRSDFPLRHAVPGLVDVATANPSATPAGLQWRLAAIIYDLFPLAGIWFACGVIGVAVNGGVAPSPGSLGAWLQFILLFAASYAYFLLSWRRGGQTLGMRAWRLRVLDLQGRAPRDGALHLRFAVALLAWLPAGLGYLWSVFDPQRRAWHDIASHTVLVRMAAPAGTA